MKILVNRFYKGPQYTIGRLYIDGVYFCDTLEDVDRKLTQGMSDAMIRSIKIPNETAVPSGTYQITLKTFSPKFGSRPFYKEVCNGYLPRLLNVKGFDGILLHAGSNKDHTSGCLLVGKNTIVGQLTDSQNTFKELYRRLKEADDRNEDISITIN